jgi:hypothetical protein
VRGRPTYVSEMIWKEEARYINRSADEDEQLHERPAQKCATAAAVDARIRDAEDTDKGQAQQRNRAPQGTSGANEQIEGEERDDDVEAAGEW